MIIPIDQFAQLVSEIDISKYKQKEFAEIVKLIQNETTQEEQVDLKFSIEEIHDAWNSVYGKEKWKPRLIEELEQRLL